MDFCLKLNRKNRFFFKGENPHISFIMDNSCEKCEVYTICGGRCLFANYHNFWSINFFIACKTVKHLINELKRFKPLIENIIEEGTLSFEMFDYPKFNNYCEIIP